MSYSDWQKIDLHILTDWSRKTKENDYNGSFRERKPETNRVKGVVLVEDDQS